MTEPALIHTHVDRDVATELLVKDVMVRRPKTLPSDATVTSAGRPHRLPSARCQPVTKSSTAPGFPSLTWMRTTLAPVGVSRFHEP